MSEKKKQLAKESNQSYRSVPIDEGYNEMIEGVRYEMQPSPVIIHQIVLVNIHDAIRNSCKPNGVILPAPVDVYFDKDNCLIPDLIFISNENLNIIKQKRIEGAPDLVVEILSPSTSKNDRQRKKLIYERFGVKEYWIVDSHHHTFEQFILKENLYEFYKIYSFGEILTSPLFACISINLTDIFEDALRFEERFSSNEG
ncbi:Uma2 family endonuclease [Metabacillus herbersteinensis]|uniref:Uma2 family endonuclease n=1 Tax=Metabacillus herbersteinensis TaxID=283816 RepID=A0ABV6GFM4_9BACI